MKFVISHPKKYGTHPAMKFADTNVGAGDGFDTYPIYAIGFMEREQDEMIVPVIDVKNLKIPE